MKNVVLILTLIIFLERKFTINNVVIMGKKEFFDIFDIHKYRKYDKNYNSDKNFDKIPLELFDEAVNFNKNFVKTNINCNKKNCRSPYGECLNNRICECLEGYASIEINSFNSNKTESKKPFDNNIYCNYKQKNQLFGFLFEFIFIFGVGQFYLNRFIQGISKFILFVFLCFMLVLIKKFEIKANFFIDENISNKRNLIINILMILSLCSFSIIHIYDIYMLATNSYLDGYGVEVLSWNKVIGKIILFDFNKMKLNI